MASALRSLPLLLFVSVACSQLIGLGSLEKTDEDDADDDTHEGGANDGGSGNKGGTSESGGAPTGGRANDGGRGNNPSGGGGGTAGHGGGNLGGAAGAGGGGAAGVSPEGGSAGLPPVVSAGSGGTDEGGNGGATGGTDTGGAGSAGEGGTGIPPGCTQQELLTDGSFDEGSSVWLWESTDDYAVILEDQDGILNGTYFAWLGGDNGAAEGEYYENEVYQLLTIPTKTTVLSVHCQALMGSEEPADEIYDVARFTLASNGLNHPPLIDLGSLDNTSVADEVLDWGRDVSATELAAKGLLGQSVFFDLRAKNDDTNNTNFFVDDCSVVATICP